MTLGAMSVARKFAFSLSLLHASIHLLATLGEGARIASMVTILLRLRCALYSRAKQAPETEVPSPVQQATMYEVGSPRHTGTTKLYHPRQQQLHRSKRGGVCGN